MKKFVKLFPIILLSVAAFGLNNLFYIPDWYEELQKRVWTLTFTQVDYAEVFLYTFSGIAFWLVWKGRSLGDIRWTAFAYGGVLLLSSMWSLLFFGLQSPLAAFFDMAALTAMLTLAAAQFYRKNKVAGYLMIPCIAGALFFTVNNYQLYQGFLEMLNA